MTAADAQITDLKREVTELREMVTDIFNLIPAAYEHGWRQRGEAMAPGRRDPRVFRPDLRVVRDVPDVQPTAAELEAAAVLSRLEALVLTYRSSAESEAEAEI